jgi:hypothetical protein
MNDIKDAVDGEAPPVARIGGDRLGGPPPPVTPRFLQHVQAAAPRCNKNRNTSKAQCCGSGSGSRRAKLTHKSRKNPPPPVTPRFLQHVQAAAPRCNTNRNTDKAQCCGSGSGSRRAELTHKSSGWAGGPPPPVTPRFLQHVQAPAPRCNTNRNTSKAQCCGSGSGSRRAKLTHKSSGWAGRHRQLRRAFFNMCRLWPPAATQIELQVSSVGDPDIYGPPGSESISQRYRSRSGSFPFLIKVLGGLK